MFLFLFFFFLIFILESEAKKETIAFNRYRVRRLMNKLHDVTRKYFITLLSLLVLVWPFDKNAQQKNKILRSNFRTH